ncbi:hypothetical protein [Algoriphagus resistens]|uniref:hypothetical protein n=1 Tax=Algoriphagus resistens TaxID=1750590 RepID=UPI000716C274|nr:hypothetical protein [Algoriphagus resistens]
MITSDIEYKATLERIKELLANLKNIGNSESEGFVELNMLSDLIADYEEKTLLRDELIKGEESGTSHKTMGEILEEAKRLARKK